MKRILTTLFLLLIFQSAAWSQTITIDSVSGTTFCAGDPISVTFTVTGTWQHNNAFTLQLSNDSGTFDQGFQNIGSIQDTASGTFTIYSSAPINAASGSMNISMTIHFTYDTTGNRIDSTMDTTYDTTEATNYRVRVIGAYPYTKSADNGTAIWIGQAPGSYYAIYQNTQAQHDPEPSLSNNNNSKAWAANISSILNIAPNALNKAWIGDSVYVDHGEDANPASLSVPWKGGNTIILSRDSVTYSSAGTKQVIIRTIAPGGCSFTDTAFLNVYDCTPPTIPNDAIIISQKGDTGKAQKTYWVNPGIPFVAGEQDTIFAEAGATISGNTVSGNSELNIIYLKPGASSSEDDLGVVIYAPGASAVGVQSAFSPTILECDSLSFDYSVAPPNSIMHINTNEGVIAANISPAQIQVSPNPTTGLISIENIPAYANVTVANVLGETILQMKANASGAGTLDLTNAAQGTYYVRIASGNGVVTKQVVKE